MYIYISKNSFLTLNPFSDLSHLFNQCDNFFLEQKNNPENIVNSNYYDIDQLQSLKFSEKKFVIPISHKMHVH